MNYFTNHKSTNETKRNETKRNETNQMMFNLPEFIAESIAGFVGVVGSAFTIAGFGTGGIAAGSVAAGIQSSIGNVAAGSVFAWLQSIGATGGFFNMAFIGLGFTVSQRIRKYIRAMGNHKRKANKCKE